MRRNASINASFNFFFIIVPLRTAALSNVVFACQHFSFRLDEDDLKKKTDSDDLKLLDFTTIPLVNGNMVYRKLHLVADDNCEEARVSREKRNYLEYL